MQRMILYKGRFWSMWWENYDGTVGIHEDCMPWHIPEDVKKMTLVRVPRKTVHSVVVTALKEISNPAQACPLIRARVDGKWHYLAPQLADKIKRLPVFVECHYRS